MVVVVTTMVMSTMDDYNNVDSDCDDSNKSDIDIDDNDDTSGDDNDSICGNDSGSDNKKYDYQM